MLGEGRPSPPAVSGTISILFADLRDYTAFVEAHGDAAAAELIDRYRRIVRAAVAGTGGGEIKTEGDSFYVVFPSARQALQAALTILKEAQIASRHRTDRPLRIGIGIHAGEPVPHQGQYVGSAVNIASRLAAQAGPGELLVSDLVRGLLRTSRTPPMEERSGLLLKGVDEPPRIFSVAVPPAESLNRGAAEPPEVVIPGGAPTGNRMLCPQLVGRESDLDALEKLLGVAVAGQGSTVLIAGDAGLGKTALLREFSERALARGARVLAGECTEVEARRPFGPFIEIAKAAVTEFPRLEASELLNASFRLGGPGALEPLAEMERYRVHAAFTELLNNAAAAAPIAVVVDDLHWADEATLELFPYLARKLREQRVLLVGTYRSDELHRLHPLNHMLADIGRTRLATNVSLRPLTMGQTGAVIRATLGLDRAPTPEFRAAVHERCGGNPFFTEEVLRVLVDRGDLTYRDGAWRRTRSVFELAIPGSIRDSVLERMRDLPAETQRAIQVAAVIGQRFDFDLLQQVSGLAEGSLLEALRAGVDAQIIEEETDGDGEETYSFRHALTRESILAELLKRERRLLHRAVGEAIDSDARVRPEERAEELAYHFDHARDLERARRYHQLAAMQALRVFGFAQAVQHLERALDLAPDDDPELADLQLQLAHAANSDGDSARAGRAAAEARRLFQAEENAIGSGAALTLLSHSHWDTGDTAGAEEFAAEAVRILEPLGESPELAAAYARVAGLAMVDGRDADAITHGTRAIQMAERTGALEARVNALISLGSSEAGDEGAAGTEHLREALDLALKHDLPTHAARAYGNLIILTDFGDPDERSRLLLEAREHARRFGLRFEQLITHDATHLSMKGDWDEALRTIDEERSDSIFSAARELQESFILTARQGPDRRHLCEGPRSRLLVAGDRQWLWVAAQSALTVFIAEDYDAALVHADAVAAVAPAQRPMTTSILGPLVISSVLAARAAERPETAARWIQIGLHLHRPGHNPWIRARLAFAAAERAVDDVQLDVAIDKLGESVQEISSAYLWSAVAASFVRVRLAEIRLQRGAKGDREAAQAELDAAVPFWRRARADWYIGRLKAWAGARGLTFRAE